MDVSRSGLGYGLKMPDKNAPVIAAMRTLSGHYPRFGSRRIRVMLGRDGIVVGKDRCASLWAKAGLQVPKKRRRRRIGGSRQQHRSKKIGVRMGTYFAAAYWGSRKETVEACAHRATVFFEAISQIAEYLKEWRQQGRSRSIKTIPIENSTQNALIELFLKGQNRKDINNKVINDLGYRISLWNGGDTETASSLMLKCGLFSNVAGLSNAVVLELPARFDTNSVNQVRQLANSLISAWDPDWAIIASHSAQARHTDFGPFLDKALYLRSTMQLPQNISDTVLKSEKERGILLVSS